MAWGSQVSLLGLRDPGASVRADEVQMLKECPQLSVQPPVCGVVLQGFPCGIHIGLEASLRLTLHKHLNVGN